ncbi:MAG TPA: ABC transporter substrate-binding protein, partial [Anaerolineales bacterium]|nr:ABC transporter substrate-binding protein [Anaerolineales bacterium]
MKTQTWSHRTFMVLLLAALLFSLSGCETAATDIPPTPSATLVPPTATATLPPTVTSVPTDTPTPFVPKATIKIVSHSPLSGNDAVMGIDIMRGAELAVGKLAGPLIELGYKVELVSYDDRSDVGTAVSNAKEIVKDTEILCGVGHYFSRIMLQTEEIYHQAGLVFVAPSTTAAFVTESGYLEVNRVVGRNDVQGAAGAQFAKAQGFTRVFIISN